MSESTHPTCDDEARHPHHAATLVTYGDLSAMIDVAMAPMVLACWRLGIRTDESCEGFTETVGVPETCFLSFDDVSDYVAFAHALLTHEGDGSEFEARCEGYHESDDADWDHDWDWECHPYWPYHLDMSCSVVFPRSDLEEATRRLVERVEAREAILGDDPTVILSAEHVGTAETTNGFLDIGGVKIDLTSWGEPISVYVRRSSKDLSIMEVALARHDGLFGEELDEQNRQAAIYPAGPKEYWRGEMVNGPSGHMTDEEFEEFWTEDEED